MFGQGCGCGGISQRFQVIGAADWRHVAHKLLAALFDTCIQQEWLPDGFEPSRWVVAQTGQVGLTDQNFKRKLGCVAPKEQIVAEPHAMKGIAILTRSCTAEAAQKVERGERLQREPRYLPGH